MSAPPIPHILEAQQFDRSALDALFKSTDHIRTNPLKHAHDLDGKVLATLFYEPSTRTRLSFEAGMLRLGGTVISTENAAEFSSAVKGESIEDTARIVGTYADGIVIRHSIEGMAQRASEASPVPIINAGDGKGQHPTQAFLDAYTINRELGKLDGTRIAMVGDLASGRTVRSLCYLLGKYEDIDITFVSPPHLRMREDIKEYLDRHGVRHHEESDLNRILPELDIVYMTRIQKERMSIDQYDQAKGKFVINMENLELIRPDARIMHPLPHVEEIDLPLHIEKTDPRVAYFRQAENGMWIRMALLNKVLRVIKDE